MYEYSVTMTGTVKMFTSHRTWCWHISDLISLHYSVSVFTLAARLLIVKSDNVRTPSTGRPTHKQRQIQWTD